MNFRKLMAGSALAVLLLSANGTTALAMTTEQRLGDFNQLGSIIQRHYGPLRWKQETIGLDLKRVVADYNEKISHAKSDAEFYRLMAEFTSELKDAHVSATVPSTYRGRLGFLCDLVEGKVLI